MPDDRSQTDAAIFTYLNLVRSIKRLEREKKRVMGFAERQKVEDA